jgi:hypothetical protein
MTISISKIKNISIIKKNRNEKGARKIFTGSNPHSKGDALSRSRLVFLDTLKIRIMKTKEINKDPARIKII